MHVTGCRAFVQLIEHLVFLRIHVLTAWRYEDHPLADIEAGPVLLASRCPLDPFCGPVVVVAGCD